jgi:DNA gyrase/topoisomerase IV subunit B
MDAVEVDPSYFLDSARLDIMCRYLYVKSKNENTNHLYYKEIYKECIQAQTQGVEPTDKYIKDQTPKNTIQDYIDSFDILIDSFKTEGYNKEYPIYSNSVKTINGGAHRIACSLYYNQKIPTIISKDTQPKIRLLNREWFKTEGFSEQVILEWEENLDKLSGSR